VTQLLEEYGFFAKRYTNRYNPILSSNRYNPIIDYTKGYTSLTYKSAKSFRTSLSIILPSPELLRGVGSTPGQSQDPGITATKVDLTSNGNAINKYSAFFFTPNVQKLGGQVGAKEIIGIWYPDSLGATKSFPTI
jgi:hypothetical protein